MDQSKIGRFIAQRRKQANLTQAQLAETLGITDRAVSKWETGKAMPDSSIMLALCAALGISVNDLLTGEVVSVEQYNREMEKNLLDMMHQKEQADRRLLQMETGMGIAALVSCLVPVCLAAYVPMAPWAQGVLIAAGLVPLLAVACLALRIEQTAGYYQCAHCGHRYVPRYRSVFFAPHLGRTRYMRCPACHKGSWQKKVLRAQAGDGAEK